MPGAPRGEPGFGRDRERARRRRRDRRSSKDWGEANSGDCAAKYGAEAAQGVEARSAPCPRA